MSGGRRGGSSPWCSSLDEVAFLPEDTQTALADLVARGGAARVFPVLATQRPDAAAVKSLIRANLSTRIAFPVPSVHDSMVILGRAGAEQLPKKPGRLLILWDARLVEAQAYLVPLDGMGQTKPDAPGLLTAEERLLVETALERFGGWFRIRPLAEATGISHRRVGDLAQKWERMGLLTKVQRDENGHVLGRRVTEELRRLVCGSGEPVDQVELVDQA